MVPPAIVLRDPYWEAIHVALEPDAFVSLKGEYQSPEPGDLVFTSGSTSSIRSAYFEYLEAEGYTLSTFEQERFQKIKDLQPHFLRPRPCVVLGRHAPGAYAVCLLATANFEDDISPALRMMSIPFGNNQKDGLLVDPPLVSRLMLAFPVIRTDLGRFIPPRGITNHPYKLAYGELERARKLVREKLDYFKVNQEDIRDKELRTMEDSSHASNHFRQITRVPIVQTPWKKLHDPVRNTLNLPLPKFKYIDFHSERSNNLQWIMEHGRMDIAETSGYLRSVVDPPPRRFRIPRPFYSRSLRASAAFVRHRISIR
ncbi:hypothetical protein FB451DRAFT_1222012 [Mycena latifolia]|nr:hypothetical protein FB451DRAFT_1222012 [Mycena latifolia]